MSNNIEVERPSSPAEAIRTVESTLVTLIASGGVDQVYSAPIKRGDYTVIPAAETLTAVGFGVGYGQEGQAGAGAAAGGGGGGGGGGRTLSRPVAVVIVGPEGVRIEPVVDPTKVALAALTALGFVFSSMARMRRDIGKLTKNR